MTIITTRGTNEVSEHRMELSGNTPRRFQIARPRKAVLPRARNWASFTPEQTIAAIRDVRRLVLDRLSLSACDMLTLRQLLPDRIAAGLVPTMESLVNVGAVTAIGPGLYAVVARPDGNPVRPAPGRDLVVACLGVADNRNDISRYLGLDSTHIGANIAKGVKRGDIELSGKGAGRYRRVDADERPQPG